MNLPRPPQKYDADDQERTRAAINQADQANVKRNTDIEMGRARIFLKSPTKRWVLTVDDAGTLSAVLAPI